MAAQEPQVRFEMSIAEGDVVGVYSNFLGVWHTAHEFTLDFCQSLPGDETAMDVVARVKVAPTMVGRILEALSENLAVYENRFGSVPHVG